MIHPVRRLLPQGRRLLWLLANPAAADSSVQCIYVDLLHVACEPFVT